MRDGKFKPKRPLRNELYSLVGVMVLPLAILLSFPYAGIGYKSAADRPASAPGCALVTLTEAEEDAAVAATRSSWKMHNESVRDLVTDLGVEAVPETVPGAVMDIGERSRLPPAGSVKSDLKPLPRTFAAPKAERLVQAKPADSADAALAFPRKELLNID